ncbi:MAG: hypothetical protein WBF53_13475 [Litorimonas sp.]
MAFLFYFLVGLFLANAVPHLSNGLSGRRFPTPFARPPGKGLSSPVVNALWGVANLGLAAWVYHAFADDYPASHATISSAALGFAMTCIALAWWFGRINSDRR